jgi:cellulose synthase/poly-beta-1,6-N-acetylglucosamine synthase-like glycosyltransferase
MLTFSVVIPTRNRPSILANCLRSFLDLDYPNSQWELIVVNDGGEDSLSAVTPTLKQSLPLRLLTIEHAGPAAARNAGAKLASFAYLAFTDDDCRVNPDWLRCYDEGFRQKKVVALAGETLNPTPRNRAMEASQYLIEFMYDYMKDSIGNNLLLVSNNVAYRRDVFEVAGGFDESFPLAAGEDMELSHRLVAHGYRQYYYPRAKVWHHHTLTHWGHIRQQFRYGRGGQYFLDALQRHRQNGVDIRPQSAKAFYRALARSLKESEQPLSLWILIAVAQIAYQLGQLYQRKMG